MDADERAIRRLVETWMSATADGDTATVLDLVADDAVFMVPGREPFSKAEFAAAADKQSGVRIDGKSDVLEVEVNGALAFMRSHLTVTMSPSQGPPVSRSGYTLTVLRKGADGRWRLARDANLLTAGAG